MIQTLKYLFSLLLLSTLVACASYSGSGLKPGVAQIGDVLHVMGSPAMHWQNPDGSQQLAYPRGPQGTQTFMAYIMPDGTLQRIDPVLDRDHFKRIQPGYSEAQVLRTIGPPQPSWTGLLQGATSWRGNDVIATRPASWHVTTCYLRPAHTPYAAP